MPHVLSLISTPIISVQLEIFTPNYTDYNINCKIRWRLNQIFTSGHHHHSHISNLLKASPPNVGIKYSLRYPEDILTRSLLDQKHLLFYTIIKIK